MAQVLFIGGTRFVGPHAVREFRDAGHDVTLFNRGEHDDPFADDEGVDHLAGDRTDDADLAAAAERGEAGRAYNVGDWTLRTLRGIVDGIADALDTAVEVVTAGARELAAADLAPTDFPLYRSPPHVLDTTRLRELGWDPVPPATGFAETVDASPATDAATAERGPDREAEERVLGVLDTL